MIFFTKKKKRICEKGTKDKEMQYEFLFGNVKKEVTERSRSMVPLTFYSRERERDRDGNVSIVSVRERVWRYILDGLQGCSDKSTC